MGHRQHDSRPAARLAIDIAVEGTPRPLIRVTAAGRSVTARPGDLLVCYRLSPYQRVSNINGDPCTHAAILDVVDGRAVTTEMGPAGVFQRTLAQFAERYDWFAIVHLDVTATQRGQVVEAARRELERRDLRYSHAQCIGIGAYALLRRWLLPFAEQLLTLVALRGAGLAHRLHHGARATCSGFVVQCLAPAGVFEAMVLPTRARPRGLGRVGLGDLELHIPGGRHAHVGAGPWAVIASPTDVVVSVRRTHISVVGPDTVHVLGRKGRHRRRAA